MKKLLFFISLSLLIVSLGYSQTNVSGGIFANTRWTLNNSPYIVTNDLVVFPGYTLTIEAGVTVKFENNKLLEIRQANLIAAGTKQAPIIFTSNSSFPTPGIYGGIYINGGTIPEVFNFCNFEYAHIAIKPYVDYAITVKNSIFQNNQNGILNVKLRVNIDSCLFQFNTVAMQVGGGIVTNSRITQNETGMMQEGVNSTINNCILDYNQTAVLNASGTILNSSIKHNGLGLGVLSSRLSVANCNIISNQTGLSIGAGDTIKNCIIDSNTVAGIENNGYYAPYYSWIINNKIRNNNIGINETSGSPDLITKNIIENNEIGILVRTNTVYASTTGCENIFCNKICNNTSYDLKYNVPINTSAKNNYWCTTDSISTKALIYDGYINASSGLVNVIPLDTAQCYTSKGVSINKIQPFSFNFSPNPVSNILKVELATNISNTKIDIYNMIGDLLYSSIVKTNNINIDVSSFVKGLYILQLSSGDKISSQKFIKL